MLGDFENIALIGMRCTGKSGIGYELAKRLGLKFIDIDAEIEKQSGKNAKELTENGENWLEFRKIETEILQKVIKESGVVISCGGGIGVNSELDENKECIGNLQTKILLESEKTCKIWLKSNIEKIIKRYSDDIKSSNSRPKIKSENIVSDLVLQDFTRREKYQKIASFSIDTTNAESEFLKILSEIEKKVAVKTNAVIGFPIKYSISPTIHNACYKSLGIADKFSFLAIEIKPHDLYKIREIILENNLYGISVTTPLKEEIMQYLDRLEPCAMGCGAVNTIVRTLRNELVGYNTDYIGVLNSMPRGFEDKKIAILGNGGAARAACFALKEYAKNVTVFARKIDKSRELAEKFGMKSGILSWLNFDEIDIIINATSCGYGADEKPISADLIGKKHTVFDLIYYPFETTLIKDSKKNGASIIFGTEMLLNQAVRQFELYTDMGPDIEIMRQSLEKVVQKRSEISDFLSKVFISIIAKNLNELEAKIKIAKRITKNIEIRADFLDNVSPKMIKEICKITHGMNTIFTCRKKEHGGFYIGDEYGEIMMSAYRNFGYIDIDIKDVVLASGINKLQDGAKLIMSHHDFEKTPLYEDCVDFVDQMEKANADIYKLAFKVNEYRDIMTQSKVFEYSKKIALVPMGDRGKITRIYSLLLGSNLSFACLSEDEKTASGQLTYREYSDLLELFYFSS